MFNTRQEAKLNGDLYYYTGEPCKHGHISKRFVSCCACVACANEYRKIHAKEMVIRIGKYNKANPNKAIVRSLKYRATDKGRSVANASAAKRRCAKLNATPKWLTDYDKKFIEEMYEVAILVSKETGIKHHVDHVIPLQGEFVSGLNVPINLQLLTEFDNCSKSNNYDYI